MPFRIALSGLHSAQIDLKVTGNNIANSSTTGFKLSRTEFVDVYAAAYGAITSVVNGNGVRTTNIRQIFSQGNVEYTDNATDLAIAGQGFFMVSDDKGRYMTRNGTFGLDREGFVINSTGQTLQVFPAVTVGATTTFNTGQLDDLQLQNNIGRPVSTTSISTNLNLQADVTQVFDISGSALADQRFDQTVSPPFAFDPLQPESFNHVTATTVYDSLGGEHVLQLYFRKMTDGAALTNTWQAFAYMDNSPMYPTDDGLDTGADSGRPAILTFNPDGSLLSAEYYNGATGTVTAAPGLVEFTGQPTTTGSNPIQFSIDFQALTQYGSDFAVNELSQDGFTTGRLSGFDVEENGIVFARYTNGNKEILGMVALASVPNPQGLRQKGDSLWVETHDAGDTLLGQPGTSNLGLIQAGALEASTVELADQLVNMIVAQRNYQANAQVITTADQITQTLLNIR
ncbi:MAG: flagellar hook protein FlgE [Gammaproteobacteria bacterium]|nr:flagellar hook protein FlgE [Gammaproteobacteria bacterium]MDH5731318.1 flagellar hook protein FlgE [Gammaproteobacteria bacterium]